MTSPETPRPPRRAKAGHHRLRRMRDAAHGSDPHGTQPAADPNAVLDMGWGRLIFAQTFDSPGAIAAAMREEGPDRRDIAFHVRDPHVLLAEAPQELFLDPSHSFRLDLSHYRAGGQARGFFIRRLCSRSDADEVNRIYGSLGMVPVPPEFFWTRRDARSLVVFLAEDEQTGEILGTITGVDHARAFHDPEAGSSLWCLAVSPEATRPRVGEMLVRRIANYFKARGAGWLDLSVMHDNAPAIALYEKLGFRRLPLFCVKRRNPINEELYTGADPAEGLNPYARIIVDEARRRGIQTSVTDAEGGYFALSYGGRQIRCRESLSEFTSAVAMSICDDKAVTRRIVAAAGVQVPDQVPAEEAEAVAGLLEKGAVVVKPARGEQGRGISVGLTTAEEVTAAVGLAREVCDRVLVEAMFPGEDLRVIVIDGKVVATALRRAARVFGDGRTPIRKLIEAQSRRRAAATGGESRIPMDAETERCLAAAGFGFDDVAPEGAEIAVRRTANLHTGGTIHDVTGETHPALIDAALTAARAIDIPVTGIDLMIRHPRRPEHVFIEANERPGLANHEPQPTAERFIDFLFPMSMPAGARAVKRGLVTERKDPE